MSKYIILLLEKGVGLIPVHNDVVLARCPTVEEGEHPGAVCDKGLSTHPCPGSQCLWCHNCQTPPSAGPHSGSVLPHPSHILQCVHLDSGRVTEAKTIQHITAARTPAEQRTHSRYNYSVLMCFRMRQSI